MIKLYTHDLAEKFGAEVAEIKSTITENMSSPEWCTDAAGEYMTVSENGNLCLR